MRLFNICLMPGNKLCCLIGYKPIIKSFTCFNFFAIINSFCHDELEPQRRRDLFWEQKWSQHFHAFFTIHHNTIKLTHNFFHPWNFIRILKMLIYIKICWACLIIGSYPSLSPKFDFVDILISLWIWNCLLRKLVV